MISNKSSTVVHTTKGSIELNAADVVELLRARADIPAAATMRVYFAVPGGGDWSNTDIDVDDRNPLRLDWELVTEEEGHG